MQAPWETQTYTYVDVKLIATAVITDTQMERPRTFNDDHNTYINCRYLGEGKSEVTYEATVTVKSPADDVFEEPGLEWNEDNIDQHMDYIRDVAIDELSGAFPLVNDSDWDIVDMEFC